jgi:tetratricopeptide (TPR) repeat protein
MSTKKTQDAFDDLEDSFFNSGPGDWGAPAAEPAAQKAAEDARKAQEARAAEGKAAEAKKAEAAKAAEAKREEEARRAADAAAEASRADAARKAEEARLTEEARKADEARAAEEKRQADLDRAARAAARKMVNQETRIYRRRTHEELMAEDEAEAAVEIVEDRALRASMTIMPPEPEVLPAAWPLDPPVASVTAAVDSPDAPPSGEAAEASPAGEADESAAAVAVAISMPGPVVGAPQPPTGGEPGLAVGQADVGQPGVGQPEVGQPEVGQPAVGQPGVGEPGVGQPEVGQPGVGRPGVDQPEVGQPAVGKTEVGEPGVGQPGVGQPAVGEPDVGQPGVGEPDVGQPEVARAAEAEPAAVVDRPDDQATMEEPPPPAPPEDMETAVVPDRPEPPPPPVGHYVPAEDERAGWREGIALMERESERLEGERRVALLVAAARLARTRAGDREWAAKLVQQAGGRQRDPAVLLEQAEAAADATGAARAWGALAKLADGPDAAFARAEWARLLAEVVTGAGKLDLARAFRSEPGNVGLAWAWLEVCRRAGDDAGQVEALAAIASAVGGPAAAVFGVERAEIIERAGLGTEDAVAAWRAARAADPSSGPAFLALERHFRASANWGALAELYRSEGERTAGQAAESAWWYARAARVYRSQLMDELTAGSCYQAALAASPTALELRHEYNVFLSEAERWADLAESLAIEAGLAPPDARPFLHYRRGQILEDRLRQPEDAMQAFKRAAEDPAAGPAAEAVLRVLQAQGRFADLVVFLEARLERISDPSLMVTILYRMGETCEGPLDDQVRARQHFERVLDVAPGYLPALEALERVYSRLKAWKELAAVYEQRAILAEDPQQIALHRQRAGAVYDVRLSEPDRAVEQYHLAIQAVPDFAPGLDAYCRVMESRGAWAEIGRALRAGATATRDGNEAVSLAYRAARVLADRTTDRAGAIASLRRCLDLSPGFLPAVLLMKELAAREGDWSEFYRMERLQAETGEDLDRRHWRLLSAAEVAQRLPEADPGQLVRDVLRDDPTHAGAVEFAERLAIQSGDSAGLMDLYLKLAGSASGDAERVAACTRLAQLAADQGNAELLLRGLGEVVGATGVAGRPLRAIARVAESLGYPEDALRALAESDGDGTVEAARLRQQALGDATLAANAYLSVLDAGPDAGAAASLLRLSREPAVLARAHRVLAETSAGPVRAWHAANAAENLSGDDAIAAWRMALEAAPGWRRARQGLRRGLIAARDAEGLRALLGGEGREAHIELGDALEEAGDLAGAVASWREVEGEDLAVSVRLERGLGGLGDWRAVFELLQQRMGYVGPAARAEIGAKCRWILSDRLAESDEAWEFYQRLHAQRPEDREVIEALARIATARGETALASGFLDELAAFANEPPEAARLQRRRAEVLEKQGQLDAARSALTRALDFVPDDQEALAGLRRLAEGAGDWQGVVGVLARQAALSQGQEQIDRFAEIARLWEDRLQDRGVAADAWRRVLDLSPDNAEALQHLVGIAEAGRDWPAFAEHGQALLRTLEGEARSSLMRRLANALLDHLHREDEAVGLLEAASSGPHADVEAARRLEQVCIGRGDNARLVDAILRRSRAATDPTEKADCLARAARIKLEVDKDRAAAAAIYEGLLALAPDHPDALRFRGDWLWDAGDLAGAAEVFGRLEAGENERDLDDFDTQIEVSLFFHRFGETLRKLDRRKEAIEKYDRALQLNPTHLPTLEGLGPMLVEAGDWGRAERIWRQVLQLVGGLGNPEQLARVYVMLGTVEANLGQVDKARKRFTKALELRPNDIDALKGYGGVLHAAGDWNNLLTTYNHIIYHTHDPDDVIGAYLKKGYVLDAKMNLADKAAQHYEKSLAFDPAQPLALLRLGELALRRQDWPEAASLADRGLQLGEERQLVQGGLLLVRGIAYQACGDAKAATEAWSRAVELAAEYGAAGPIEDYEKVHEHLRARIQAGKL